MFMSLFAKKEKRTLLLDYRFIPDEGLQTIEAYGEIGGKMQYLNACYHVRFKGKDEPWFTMLVEDLVKHEGEKIEVTGIFKNGALKDFVIELDSVAKVTQNENIKRFGLFGWGISDKPYKQEEEKQ